jgi:ABC-type phosphonate transport system ATPase subunit
MARKKTTFRKATLTLAEALNVEPAEALRIARHFSRYGRRRDEETEAEATSTFLTLLERCDHRDRDSALHNTLDAVGRHGARLVVVLRRYRELKRERLDWERVIEDARYLGLDDLPARFCGGDAAKAKRIAKVASELEGLLDWNPRLAKAGRGFFVPSAEVRTCRS